MNTTNPGSNARRWPAGWTLIPALLVVGLGFAAAVRLWSAGSKPSSSPPPVVVPAVVSPPVEPIDVVALRQGAWHRLQPRLDAADEAAASSVEEGLGELRWFFEERKRGTRRFAEGVLSARGKWALVRSKLPFTDNDGHVRFLNTKFADCVFRPDELQAAVESAVKAHIADLAAIENQLLVDVRADLADLPFTVLPRFRTDEVLQRAYRRMAEEVAAMAAGDTRISAVRGLGSFVAGDIAAHITIRVAKAVATRMGVSAGALGAGAAGSWATFGLSIVAAIIVDIAADWVIGWFYDPVAEVALKVEQTLDRVRDLLIEGAAETPGLRQELERLNEMQAEIRRQALRKLVFDD